MRTETLAFLRKRFNIPKSEKICWGIIEEITATGTTYRLGVFFDRQRNYIDVARGEITSPIEMRKLARRIQPAQKIALKECNRFVTENGAAVEVSKTYIADIYKRKEFSKEIMRETLL